jgi:hypothetical protein
MGGQLQAMELATHTLDADAIENQDVTVMR